MTEYEIQCNETWAWYKGYIHDYRKKDEKFYVSFPDNWKKGSWEPATNIRPMADELSLTEWAPNPGEEVECQARAEENQPLGWWGCKIVSKSGPSDYWVAFHGWPDAKHELLNKQFLRPKNQKRPISTRSMDRIMVPVPMKLGEWVSGKPEELTSLKTSPRVVHLDFIPRSRSLIVVAPTRTVEAIKNLILLHFKKRLDLIEQMRKTREARDRLAAQKKAEQNAVRQSFMIHPLLTGYLYGKDWANYDRLRKQKGILRINVNDSSCEVVGTSKMIVEETRKELEIVACKIVFPRIARRFIFGDRFTLLNDLRSECDLNRLLQQSKYPDFFKSLKDRVVSRTRASLQQRDYRGGDVRANSAMNEERKEALQRLLETVKDIESDDLFKQPGSIVDLIPFAQTLDLERSQKDFQANHTGGSSSLFNPQSSYDFKEGEQKSNGRDRTQPDSLIAIGRKYLVNRCVCMLKMQLIHFYKLDALRGRVREMAGKLRKMKGWEDRPLEERRGGRGYGGGRDGYRGGASGDLRDVRDVRFSPNQSKGGSKKNRSGKGKGKKSGSSKRDSKKGSSGKGSTSKSKGESSSSPGKKRDKKSRKESGSKSNSNGKKSQSTAKKGSGEKNRSRGSKKATKGN